MSNQDHVGAESKRNEARARFETLLRDQFKVQAAFVPVRVVARVLGFAPSTLNGNSPTSTVIAPRATTLQHLT